MTKDEIIKLAREAGGSPYVHRSAPNEPAFAFGPEGLQAFALACYEAGRTAERSECERLCARIGDYVLATKWNDGDPGDPWALGIYAGIHSLGETQRHMVNNADGSTIRPNGFRKCHPIRKDVGRWLLTVAADELERSKPCTVNLWTMLTPSAFDLELDTE